MIVRLSMADYESSRVVVTQGLTVHTCLEKDRSREEQLSKNASCAQGGGRGIRAGSFKANHRRGRRRERRAEHCSQPLRFRLPTGDGDLPDLLSDALSLGIGRQQEAVECRVHWHY